MGFQETNSEFRGSRSDITEEEYIFDGKINEMDVGLEEAYIKMMDK